MAFIAERSWNEKFSIIDYANLDFSTVLQVGTKYGFLFQEIVWSFNGSFNLTKVETNFNYMLICMHVKRRNNLHVLTI